MIKSAKINFLLLLLTCGLAMPSKGQQLSNVKTLYHSLNTIAVALSALVYYNCNAKRGPLLPSEISALLTPCYKQKYQRETFWQTKLPIISATLALLSSGMTLFDQKKYNGYIQCTGSLAMLSIIMAFIDSPAITYSYFDEYFHCIQHKPTKEHVETLLRNGIDPNEYLYYGHQKQTMLKFILNYKGLTTPPSPFFNPNNRDEVVQYMRNTIDGQKYDERESAVQLLVNQPNININVQSNRHGSTALHAAVETNHAPFVEMLLAYVPPVGCRFENININFKSSQHNGDTPLHLAAKYRNIEAIRLLLAQGADTTITNNEGKTAQQCIELTLCPQIYFNNTRSYLLADPAEIEEINGLFTDHPINYDSK